MDISKYTKQMGLFLKADEVKANANKPFVIIGEPVIAKSTKFDTEKLRIEGEFNQQERVVDISKTNARTIAKVLGEETKGWIGHQIFFETYKTKTSDGKLVDALNVKEVK